MIVLYLLLLLSLGLYSYSQIDLNLTLLQSKWFLDFQYWAIQLGYFNRPLSTVIFVGITLLLVAGYYFLVRKSVKLSRHTILFLLSGLSVLGLLSYPAFSHDIFNYLFSARELVLYHANPYTAVALNYPADTWTRFMQWTHVPFAWGPGFLAIIVPFYFLGVGKFILTLFSFKLLAVLAYLGSGYYIYNLAGKKGLIFFALNPLIIYEVLIAGHVDVVMLFFALLGHFLFTKKKLFTGWLALLFSVAVKYATVTFIPWYLYEQLGKYLPKKIRILSESIVQKGTSLDWLCFLALIGAVIQAANREVLPHYLIVPFGFIALNHENRFWNNFAVLTTIVILLVRYLPFLYSGQWWTIALPKI